MREYVTDRYWEEGDQIKFKRYGRVIGIEKDLVKEIGEKFAGRTGGDGQTNSISYGREKVHEGKTFKGELDRLNALIKI